MPGRPAPSRVTLLCFFLSVALLAPPVAGQQPADFIARVEAARVAGAEGPEGLGLEELLERSGVPGASVAVIRDFEVHWARGYGVADVTDGRPVEVGTLFQAASMSKPVTAMAALRLAQEGRFTVDDDVNALLGSWKVPRSESTGPAAVTLRSLFSHTSGADDGFGFPGYDPSASRPTAVQILRGEPPSNVIPDRIEASGAAWWATCGRATGWSS